VITPLKEQERSQQEWNRKAKDAVNQMAVRAIRKVLTKTADITQAVGEWSLINNKTGSTCTITLLSAFSFPDAEIFIKNMQTQTVVSASSNVCPIGSVTPGTAILAATVGAWAILRSDGTNWHIMARGT
jgi:hypothetical protein